MARLVCKVLGFAFVAIGLMMIVRGADENAYHNLLHLVTGAGALAVGFIGSTRSVKRFCQGFGGFYLALGVLGMLLGDPSMNRQWDVGPLLLDVADHAFHIVLGLVFLASGLLTRSGVRRLRRVGRTSGAMDGPASGAPDPDTARSAAG
jgi:hypothetical protein